MNRHGDIEYALARVGSRMGGRPREASWRAISVIRDPDAFIDAARAGPHALWISGIGRQSNPHAIEERLRDRMLALVHEVRGWMPMRWQPAIDWAAVLLDLPPALYLARGNPALPWMSNDASYRMLGREPWVVQGGASEALRSWRAEWIRRMPREGRNDLVLRKLGHLLTTEPRRSLEPALVHLYRRATLEPAAAFVFLALSALDIERLRGELLLRALLPPRIAA
jgi:hypothetical protein